MQVDLEQADRGQAMDRVQQYRQKVLIDIGPTIEIRDICKLSFRWRRWGSSPPGLSMLDPPLGPHQYQRKFFGACVWGG